MTYEIAVPSPLGYVRLVPVISTHVIKYINSPVKCVSFGSDLGCGHCKKAKPEFMDAAKHFADNNKVCFYVFLKLLCQRVI